jgi:hypothetical protein
MEGTIAGHRQVDLHQHILIMEKEGHYSRTLISGPLLNWRNYEREIPCAFQLISQAFSGICCKRELCACFSPPRLSKFDCTRKFRIVDTASHPSYPLEFVERKNGLRTLDSRLLCLRELDGCPSSCREKWIAGRSCPAAGKCALLVAGWTML